MFAFRRCLSARSRRSRRLLHPVMLGGVALGLMAAGQPVVTRSVPPVAPAPAPLLMPSGPPASPPTASAPPALLNTLPQQAAPPTHAPSGRPNGAAERPVRTASLALTGLLDRQVNGRDGGSVGHVIDVLVDPDGHPEALLVETGGFLGVGNRHIAIGWADVWFPEHQPGGTLRVNMTANEVRSAPAFVPAPRVTIAVGSPSPPPGPPPPVPPAPAPLPMPSAAARTGVPVATAPSPLIAPRLTRSNRFR